MRATRPSHWTNGDQIAGRYAVFGVREGGMGSVYVVFDHVQQCPYAIKTVRPDLLKASPDVLRRFKTEATAWVGLDRHPNVVEAAAFEHLEGTPCLILEYVDGGDLSELIQSGSLSHDPEEILRLGIQFCDGMVHAAAHGVAVHRDIKPANCMLSRLGSVKVTDFGLAKILDSGDYAPSSSQREQSSPSREDLFTVTGVGMGTLPYMAPEQFIDAKAVDVRADVYSFGVLLYEMTSGRRPFIRDTWEEYEEAHQQHSPPHLPIQVADIDGLVQQCLAKEPDSRPENFGRLRGLLASALGARSGEEVVAPPERANFDVSEWLAKARSFAALGLHERAATAYKSALSIEPTYLAALEGLFAELSALGQLDELVATAKELSVRSNDDVETLTLCRHALELAGDTEGVSHLMVQIQRLRSRLGGRT